MARGLVEPTPADSLVDIPAVSPWRSFPDWEVPGHQLDDPLAQQMVSWQAARTVPVYGGPPLFYPETDERFCGFENVDELKAEDATDAIPYLLVAAGYTHSPDDWPAEFEIKKPSTPPSRSGPSFGDSAAIRA